MPNADDKRPLMQRLSEDASSVITDLIYEKVNSLLGAGDQLFTMEFPARPLNGASYTYDADDIYSVITKPIAVQEAEFILSDGLFDTVPIAQSGNGEKLSTVFSTLLNNYVPKLDFLQEFVTDKNALRQWLLTEVDYLEESKNPSLPSKMIKISRMELCKKLYAQFLTERNRWTKEKNKTYNDFKSANTLEEYAQWVTTEATVRDEQLSNLFNDAVVRGNYHEVMTILGFLNIESPAELLEKTKQNMRSSSRRSLDGSRDTYPVQFQPTNWFKALKPNLHPKDLTMSSEALVAEYRAKERSIRNLEKKLSELSEQELSSTRIQELKTAAAEARERLRLADAEITKSCGQGAKDVLHMAIRIYQKVSNPLTSFTNTVQIIKEARNDPSKELTGTSKQMFDLLENVATSALDSMQENYNAVSAAIKSMEDTVSAQTEYAASMTQNLDTQKNLLIGQINDIKADLDYLRPLVSNTLAAAQTPDPNEPANPDSEAKSPLLPQADNTDISDSTFMDVILSSENITKKSQESSEAATAQGSWKVGGWFFSAGHSYSSSSSSHRKADTSDTSKIEIGFRVTKVNIERGGWFNPSIFKMSNNFFRLADMRAGAGTDKDKIRLAMTKENTDTELKKLVSYTSENGTQTNYLLPSFPTAFIIAKDITIRVAVTSETMESEKKYVENQSASSGGFFGFSASSGSSSKSTSESAYVGSRNNFIYIRIPGPQILGWFQQMVPIDQATHYKPMNGNPFETKNILQMLNAPQNNFEAVRHIPENL